VYNNLDVILVNVLHGAGRQCRVAVSRHVYVNDVRRVEKHAGRDKHGKK